METTTLKYNLKEINDISCSGFSYEIPKETYDIINYLCTQVGSSGINSNIFSKSNSINTNTNLNITLKNKKKHGNKGMEMLDITFQSNENKNKNGIEFDINELRLCLNKLTDKTFLDTREKIINKINYIVLNLSEEENLKKVGNILYEMCSTNKFYSKIFADLFAELASSYQWLNKIFESNYSNIMEQYNNIQYIDYEKDYDGFCETNKKNEKRRAITTFYYNLALNGYIPKEGIIKILRDILTSIVQMINIPNKKNEIDELTEIVGILFNKKIIEEVNNQTKYYILEHSILDTISSLSKKKSKDYLSLSNKAIFKYMDLNDIQF